MGKGKFSSRLGSTLASAGYAIGLSDVWRFSYAIGQYGRAAFVPIYLASLLALGLPVVIVELAIGWTSQRDAIRPFGLLEPKGGKWYLSKYIVVTGNCLLMTFCTTVAGWMVLYCVKTLKGDFSELDVTVVTGGFTNMLSDPILMIMMMATATVGYFIACDTDLQNGMEKVTKIIITSLLVLMVILAGNSLMIDGGQAGLESRLKPGSGKIVEVGTGGAVFAALEQTFFILNIGIGMLAISGSYVGREERLTREAANMLALGTLVAFMVGLIIFPAYFAYGVDLGSGPSLILIILSNVFNHMTGGRVWGTLFLLFMSFAFIPTVIAVSQSIIPFVMDSTGYMVKKVVAVNITIIILLSLSCVLGFDIWSGFMPLEAGSNIQDLEDPIVGSDLLSIGSLVYLLFCANRYGWGCDKFLEEANAGTGLKSPKGVKLYASYTLPLITLGIFIQGYWVRFMKQ